MTSGFASGVLETSGLSPLELSSGMARGNDPTASRPPDVPAGCTARAALEAVVLRGLQRDPCVVSFSGGRDSSSVLAVAVHVARREGLPLPVPVSLTFPDAADSQEGDWQEEVVRHLRLPDWERLEFHDELDLVGPYAERVLRTHGLLWPFNSHFHLPVAEMAPGGAILTGFGGDELMASGWVWGHEMAVLAGERKPQPRDLVRIAAAVSPRSARKAFLRRRMRFDGPPPRPWLTPQVDAAVTDQMLEDMLNESLHFGRSVRGWIGMRYRRLIMSALGKVAAMSGATAEHPLSDSLFLAAVASERGRRGFVDRTKAVQFLVGDLLPTALINRSTKASFGDAFWSVHSRSFAAEWDGSGIDTTLVDGDLLRVMWTSPTPPDGRTNALFQAAWVAQHISADGPAADGPAALLD